MIQPKNILEAAMYARDMRRCLEGSASDLLACCKTARRRLEEIGHDVSWLDDAIAKAEGRSVSDGAASPPQRSGADKGKR